MPVTADSVKISEKQLTQSLINVARSFDWLVYHTHDSRFSEPGFVDLVLVRPPRIIFAELKTSKGKLSKGRWNKAMTRWLPGQDTWKEALEQCPGIEYALWRPEDLDEAYKTLQ